MAHLANTKLENNNLLDFGSTVDSYGHGDSETVIPHTSKEASSIKAIDKTSVHRICSGQVVLTLATAVKELVENSIDAGATSVEIKLKDYGSESIEVIDNGFGVEEKNFEGLTLKHHTSKLQDFEDLINVSTFGFRGEALSSLCALSNMTIITRHKSTAVGTRLDFDQNGKLLSKKSAPRQIGTTVQVQNIFHTLPVRHKEFQKNIKKEFAKLIQVLNAYCIVNTGVRISCSNMTAKGTRNTIVSTSGNQSMKENIANVFNPKQLQSLLEFKQVEAEDDICADFGIKPQQKAAAKFRIAGFVSQCEHGQGRSSSDRQFIFINKRPCDSAKIVKVVNEVYHSYNRHQNPFVAINITMDKESVDVNVTPDKRQIFLEGERLLLAILKTSLIKMYEPTTSVYRVNNVLPSSQFSSPLSKFEINGNKDTPPGPRNTIHSDTDSVFSDSPSLSHSLSKLKRSFSSAFAKQNIPPSTPDSASKRKTEFSSPLSSCKRSSTYPSSRTESGSITQFFSRYQTQQLMKPSSPSQAHGPRMTNDRNISSVVESDIDVSEIVGFGTCDTKSTEEVIGDMSSDVSPAVDEQGDCKITFHSVDSSHSMPSSNSSLPNVMGDGEEKILNGDRNCSGDRKTDDQESAEMDHVKSGSPSPEDLSSSQSPQGSVSPPKDIVATETQSDSCTITITDHELDENNGGEPQRKSECTVKFSLADLRKRLNSHKDKSALSSSSFSRSFRAKICPNDNKSAEDELQKEISKDMFSKMDILGQFNLGFIITKLGSDLFIVDQHATDEKYNFEMLQRHTVLQSQRLIVPQCLELTASNETILVDNLDVFKKNGFDFKVEPDALPTQRVKLVSAPQSKNWTFGKDDIEEMVFMLTDSPNVMCRPTRIRMMFASRSCRKSVMIGTPLNKAEMKKISEESVTPGKHIIKEVVCDWQLTKHFCLAANDLRRTVCSLVYHMGEIEQPWNCPHGRPTMRHLFNMDMLPS